MPRLRSVERVQERWSALLPQDFAFLQNRTDIGRLDLAVQLSSWRANGRFPVRNTDVPPAVVGHLARQIGVPAGALDGAIWTGRRGRSHRLAIIGHLGLATFDDGATGRLQRWLTDCVLPGEPLPSDLDGEIDAWFADNRVVKPGPESLAGLLRAARASYDDAALRQVAARLDGGARGRLGALLFDDKGDSGYGHLCTGPGAVGLASLLAETGKLDRLRGLTLPPDLLRDLHPDQVARLRHWVAAESVWEIRRHPEPIRLALLALWCAPRAAGVLDGLVDLLIQMMDRITRKADSRVARLVVECADQKRSTASVLVQTIAAAADGPEAATRGLAFRAIDQKTLAALVREARALDALQHRSVRAAVRASYASHYRPMMRTLLATLDFQSDHETHRSLLDAVDAIRHATGGRDRHFEPDGPAIKGVVAAGCRDVVVERAPAGRRRVDRIDYEVCVLRALRRRLRGRQVWVAGADRFGPPSADSPAESNRAPGRPGKPVPTPGRGSSSAYDQAV